MSIRLTVVTFSLDDAKSEKIDAAFRSFMQETNYWQGKVLLDYSLMMHKAWRPVLPMLPLAADISVLDVGTGYGLLIDELAANLSVALYGIDIDAKYIQGARALSETLAAQDIFESGSQIEFEVGDICSIPYPDSMFEFTMVREVFQFVDDIDKATEEIKRVTKPTGFVCVSDNDDGLFLSYPEPTEAFKKLHQAIEKEQSSYGGDRKVGRKISTILSNHGFEILAVNVIPEARHWKVTPQDPERFFLLEQLREAKERLVSSNALSSSEYDALLRQVESEPPSEQFRFNARVLVIGRKPR